LLQAQSGLQIMVKRRRKRRKKKRMIMVVYSYPLWRRRT
jgi:hypothetical protein